MIFRIAAKLFVQDSRGNILLLRRSKTHPRYPLQWDLPGGFVEENEDHVAGLVRELQEEAQLTIDPATVALRYADTKSYPNGSSGYEAESVVRLYFVGTLATERPEAHISWEHAEAAWAAPDEVAGMLAGTPFASAVEYLMDNRLLDK